MCIHSRSESPRNNEAAALLGKHECIQACELKTQSVTLHHCFWMLLDSVLNCSQVCSVPSTHGLSAWPVGGLAQMWATWATLSRPSIRGMSDQKIQNALARFCSAFRMRSYTRVRISALACSRAATDNCTPMQNLRWSDISCANNNNNIYIM